MDSPGKGKSPDVISVIDNLGRTVLIETPAEIRRNPKRQRRATRDDDTRPPVTDWTGHQFKTKAELTVNYDHLGRERMTGPIQYRSFPIVPGVKHGG